MLKSSVTILELPTVMLIKGRTPVARDPIMENHMEKKMENEMETGYIRV